MTKTLPVLSGKKLVKFFSKNGFQPVRKKGSHIVLRRINEPHTILVIPDHTELDRGTLRGIIKDAGLTVDEFLEKYK